MARYCFTFFWKIENFSFLPKLNKNEEISSPFYLAENLENTLWSLRLHHPGYSQDAAYPAEDAFRLHLFKKSMAGPNCISLDYEISVLSKPGSKVKSVTVSKFWFHEGNSLGTPLRITSNEIFQKRENLPEDVLTILCKMRYHTNQFSLEPAFSIARTQIDAERKCFIWTIDNFSNLQANEQKSVSVILFSSYQIYLALTIFTSNNCGSFSEGDIHLKLKAKSKLRSSLLVLGISVQDTNDESAYHFQKEYMLKKEYEELSFPLVLAKKQLMEAKDSLLPENALSLKCDMVVYDVVLNRIELSGFGRKSTSELSAVLGKTPLRLGKRKRHPRSNSLTNDLRYLFEEKQHADVNLQVHDETFPVHRAVLSARSPVFKTMFGTDMKEKLTNTIRIDDIEPETMRRLLLYIYSEKFDSGVEWENVSSLYLAADKYAVLDLKEECSSYLMAHINITNVCETLVLADMLNDLDLKDFVLNFIQDKCKEVLNSNEWKELGQKRPQLTIDILTRLYRNVKRF